MFLTEGGGARVVSEIPIFAYATSRQPSLNIAGVYENEKP